MLIQLGAIVIILRQFQIESLAFREVAVLAFTGFAIHYFLPQRYRLSFFAALSIVSVVLILGLGDAAWLLGFGLVLLGICHLPLKLWIRVGLLLLVGGFAAAAKIELISGPWSAAIWPILASMFMFRLIVYVYDMQHEKMSLARSISYFFMLPNICFPMFPVVDYRGFRRTYYNSEEHEIYQTGIDWMVRGIIHLILYRIIYYYWTLTPAEVIDPDTLTQYLVSNFLLYLRISGYFHLITGMLHLFGFNLLPTHHLYCLASSFTDFWRRINIYWKDFMMKIFYYPLFFRLRRFGEIPAIVIATIIVFVLTWMLHSYQWFWLRGDFPIIWQDGIFWMGLALLVVVSAVREFKRGRDRTLGSATESWRSKIVRGLRTVVLFFTICVLWSIWTSESIGQWFSMWSFLWHGIPGGGNAFPGLLIAVAAVVFVSAILVGRESSAERHVTLFGTVTFTRSTIATFVLLALMTPLGLPQIYSHFGANIANVVVSLKSGGLSRADAAAMERGYYEGLTNVNRFNSQLWEIYMNRPARLLDITDSGLSRIRDDFLQIELARNYRSETEYGSLQTNRWGMRDQDYAPLPPDGAVRGLLLGYSTVLGWGVAYEETFESILERRINQGLAESADAKFELLNLAVPGYRPPQQAMALDEALKFAPHLVFYTAAGREQWNTITFLAEILEKKVDIPYPDLKALIETAGVKPGMNHATILKQLKLNDEALLQWVYGYIVRRSSEIRARPIWIYLPPVFPAAGDAEEHRRSLELAQAAGFEIIDLTGIFEGKDLNTLILERWDRHPNAKAHELIASRIYTAIQSNPQAYGLRF
ncbi:MAG: hypothetical protein AB7O13_19150 [Alphaproteobacteria bacterium]